MAQEHILVVMGYGIVFDSPLGNVYLPRIAKFIEEQKKWTTKLILCGGQTQKVTAKRLFGSGMSEAAAMYNWLNEYSRKNWGRPFPFESVIESQSYTAFENIRAASEVIRRQPSAADGRHITIFCEATRSANIVMLARHFMGDLVDSIDDITVETASWERADPFKQVGDLIYNKLAIHIPWLAKRARKKRLRRAEQI